MTKKHYELIADIIKHHRDNRDIADSAAYEIASGLAHEFEQDNPKFNRARFLQACGVEQVEPIKAEPMTEQDIAIKFTDAKPVDIKSQT